MGGEIEVAGLPRDGEKGLLNHVGYERKIPHNRKDIRAQRRLMLEKEPLHLREVMVFVWGTRHV
jgi:hypothetical protein